MQLGSRFSNYALTGSFFCIIHFMFLVVFNEGVSSSNWTTWIDYINKIKPLPEAYEDTAHALLTTFGIISIFFIGLVLDLIGSYFFLHERKIFIRHLKLNSDWLDKLINDECGALKENYEYLHNEGTSFVWSLKKLYKIFCKHGALGHLQAYLFSYIHVNSGESVSEMLYDNRNLWRVSRAIANTLILLSLEMLIFNIHIDVFGKHVNGFFIPTCIFIVAAYITLQSYNRMCYSLFTQVCSSFRKNNPRPL